MPITRNLRLPLIPSAARAAILQRYRQLPWITRLFLWLRWIWTPYWEIAALLPAKGKILDGGSGHGLLSLALVLQSPRREVEGTDHSSSRIAAARKAAAGMNNITFRKIDLRRISGRVYAGMAFMDVLHYLTYKDQSQLLKNCFTHLRRGGILLFRDVDRGPGFTSFWNRLHEKLMTGLRITKAKGLHFRPASEWARLAAQAGFLVRSQPMSRFPFSDVLFFCRKP